MFEEEQTWTAAVVYTVSDVLQSHFLLWASVVGSILCCLPPCTQSVCSYWFQLCTDSHHTLPALTNMEWNICVPNGRMFQPFNWCTMWGDVDAHREKNSTFLNTDRLLSQWVTHQNPYFKGYINQFLWVLIGNGRLIGRLIDFTNFDKLDQWINSAFPLKRKLNMFWL